MKVRIVLWSLILAVGVHLADAQVRVDHVPSPADRDAYPFRPGLETEVTDADDLARDLDDFIQKAYAKGYAAASVDSVVFSADSSRARVHIHLGEPLTTMGIDLGAVPEAVQRQAGVRNAAGRTHDLASVQRVLDRLLTWYTDHGHPFARVWIDTWRRQDGPSTLVVAADPDEPIVFDTLVVRGESGVRRGYLQRYLDIFPDEPYDGSSVASVRRKLAQLDFVRLADEPQVEFRAGRAAVILELEDRPSNEVDLILGFLPNDQLDDDRKLTITGDGLLRLTNSFGVGERLALEFKQIKPRTQDLRVDVAYPFVANWPVGVSGDFHLYRNDTLFSQLGGRASVDFRFSGNDRFGVFFRNESTNALTVDTQTVKASGELPDIQDVRTNTYGVELTISRLDDVLNPVRGHALLVRIGVGTKRIRPRFELRDLRGTDGEALDLYSDVRLRSVQYRVELDLRRFTPIGRRMTLLTALRSGIFIAQDIFENEKYRIGGARLLRGFDEEVVFTPHYNVVTAEFRLLLGDRSYLAAFTDVAVVEDEVRGSGTIDVPVGFGIGAALTTRGGMFRISYALGRRLDQPIRFRNGKIHFGYVNVF